jgi:ABC-type branched-subunit amino acid transport system substrate-binding protein
MARERTGAIVLRAACVPAGLLACALLSAACSTSGTQPEFAAAGPPAAGAQSPARSAQDRRGHVKVALLVPLSAQGQPGLIGKSLKQAGELALFERDNPSVQLIVKDDKGTPEGAKAAAEEAVRGGARLILGPLFAKSVAAVTPVARQADISVVAFSTDRQVARGGVYLLSFQPAPEVARVVVHAAQRGKRRFAALIPDDAFGSIVSASFTEAVSRAGGTVVAVQTYPQPASASGLLEPMRKISAVIQASEEAGAPVEALFLPGGQENLDVIARLMPQAEIDTEKVKVLGTGGMDYPNAGREPKLVGAWYAAPEPGGWSDFSQKYAKSYGSAPPRIASLAYDAVSLAIAVAGGEDQRIGPAELTRSSGFTGIDGAFRLLPDGSTDRALAILEVQKFGAGVIDAPPGLAAASSPAATSSLPRNVFNLNLN